jgi:hypothetical protein
MKICLGIQFKEGITCTMHFYHTRNVLEKAKKKDNRVQNNNDDADEDSD